MGAAMKSSLDPVVKDLPKSAPRRKPVAVPARIGVIRNPKSHYNLNSDAEHIDLPHVLHTTPRGRPAVAEVLAEFAEKRIELLVIDGGDGTVRDVLTEGLAVFGTNWPKLLVLPSGKTNALALDLGVPKKIGLGAALQGMHQARIVIRRPLLIERQGQDAKPLMGFLFGAGIFNMVIDAGQVAHRFGAFQSTAVAVTGIAGIIQGFVGIGKSRWRQNVPMRLTLGKDEKPLEQSRFGRPGERYALGVSTLQHFPLGMQPFGGISGQLRYLAWDKPLRRIIALIPAILMGWDPPFLRRLGMFRGASEELRVSLEGKFILDGESFPPGELRITPGHEVQFLVP